ncbi:MAG: CPBP family intramembrane metalloprotease, partial [Oscillospiraceae bacterium]|nr:CPBP family intramembrane metalloprotease [Oscillospiraceae bacterium]
ISVDKITLELILALTAMLFTGFFEELLFRSYLVRLLLNKSKVLAIAIPSLLFGMVHLVNLLGGADIGQTLLQVCYASAFGFMCTAFFYKTNNIIPCMICHSLVDMTNVIAPSSSVTDDIIFSIIVILLGVIYGTYLMYHKSRKLEKG